MRKIFTGPDTNNNKMVWVSVMISVWVVNDKGLAKRVVFAFYAHLFLSYLLFINLNLYTQLTIVTKYVNFDKLQE